jgi:four helix bundle protein
MTKSQTDTNTNSNKTYDIKKRTFEFAINIVNFVNELPKSIAGITLAKQLIRAGTSIGANIEEADGAFSKKDFIHKISISRKDARETK